MPSITKRFPSFATPHHVVVAQSYLTASDTLFSTLKGKDATDLESDAPAYLLLGHGAELTLKATLSWDGCPDNEVLSLGHNLAHAYQKIKERQAKLASLVEQSVKQNWREFLREARLAQIAPLSAFGISSEDMLSEFGIPSNSDIGEKSPKSSSDLQWLSDNHSAEGGRFRYLELGLYSKNTVQAFGLEEHTVPRSILWGCQYLLHELKNKQHKQQNAPPFGRAFYLESKPRFPPTLLTRALR